MAQKYIFGPIISRRLGSSLGINLLPYKTCSLNCIYCECGITTDLTIERKEYVPTLEVMESLKKYATSSRFRNAPPYCITFAGWGEPTLHSSLGEIAHFIKKLFPEQKLVLITNGTLFAFHEELLEEIRDGYHNSFSRRCFLSGSSDDRSTSSPNYFKLLFREFN